MEPFKTKIHVSFGTNPEEQTAMSQCWLRKYIENNFGVQSHVHTQQQEGTSHMACIQPVCPSPSLPLSRLYVCTCMVCAVHLLCTG